MFGNDEVCVCFEEVYGVLILLELGLKNNEMFDVIEVGIFYFMYVIGEEMVWVDFNLNYV